jgi:hypothetical protein
MKAESINVARKECFLKKTGLFIVLFFSVFIIHSQCLNLSVTAPNGGQLFDKSLNPSLDNAVVIEVNTLASIFHIRPFIFYLNDQGAPNAYASPPYTLPGAIDGHIALGWNLILQECPNLLFDCNSLPIIMAHEFGHSFAFKNNIRFNIPKNNELYADFLAGSYMYHRNKLMGGSMNIEVVANSFFNKGDHDFFSHQHHGTPQERAAALMAGYNFIDIMNARGYIPSIYDVSAEAIMWCNSR